MGVLARLRLLREGNLPLTSHHWFTPIMNADAVSLNYPIRRSIRKHLRKSLVSSVFECYYGFLVPKLSLTAIDGIWEIPRATCGYYERGRGHYLELPRFPAFRRLRT